MSDDIQLIKDKIDVADLVGEYVQLKPAGVNKKGLCPFHHEKTPSFMVNPDRQSWHCFGCAKGGDIFSFVQEMEGMEFKEALKYLADKAGVKLTNFRGEANSSQKNRIKEINKEAARFFHNFLIKMPTAKLAMDYLLKRGMKMETIEEWQVGFIPEQWDLLTQYLLKKGFGIEDLVASGLTIQKDGIPSTHSVRSGQGANNQSIRGHYDRFRGRIMFPIWNVHDEVVGFTGRILVEKENSGGKYVNTPQTLVYDKSRVIFGLNKARQEIKTKDLAVMVEGQMDVIACHQAGMKNVVASSGTALTEEQVKLLKRYSTNINMAFDSDEAGQNAAKRGVGVAIKEGLNVKVIKIPEGKGKDADECLKNNPEVWFAAVAGAKEVMNWYFERALSNKDLSNPKAKQQVTNLLLPEIALIPYAVEREHWLKELADKVGVEVSVLREDLTQIKNQNSKVKTLANNEVGRDTGYGIRVAVEYSRLDLLIEKLLTILLRFPALLAEFWLILPEEILTGTKYGAVYENLKKVYNGVSELDLDKLRNELNSESNLSVQVYPEQSRGAQGEENIIDILLMKGEWEFSATTEDNVKTEVKQLLDLIKEEWKKKRRKELQIEIEHAEKAGEKVKVEMLMKEFQEL